MANLKDLIVSGPIRAISGVIGDLTGTASKATADADGNVISSTYLKSANLKSKGSTIQPIYFDSNGAAQNTTYTLAKSVPSDAKFTDTVYTHPTTSGNKHIPSGGSSGQILTWSADGTATWANNSSSYTAGTGLSLSGTTFNHSNSITAGTAGTSAATSGSTLSVPYVTYDAQGHVTATGVHTHTITGFATSDTKNTAGSTDTSSKIFLVGATSQATNPQTYSHDTVFVDTDGALNSVTPAAGNNTTKVATTAFVTTAIGNYVKKAGDTMTGALNFANNTWNKMGDDAFIGDHNIGGHICIKPGASIHDNDGGITFFNSSDTSLVALKASSGVVTSSGALGLSNNAAKMQYNSTTEAIEFVFA